MADSRVTLGASQQSLPFHLLHWLAPDCCSKARRRCLATGRFLTIVQDLVVRYHAERWLLKALPVDMRHHPAPIVSFTLRNRTVSPVVDAFLEQARAVARSSENPPSRDVRSR